MVRGSVQCVFFVLYCPGFFFFLTWLLVVISLLSLHTQHVRLRVNSIVNLEAVNPLETCRVVGIVALLLHGYQMDPCSCSTCHVIAIAIAILDSFHYEELS